MLSCSPEVYNFLWSLGQNNSIAISSALSLAISTCCAILKIRIKKYAFMRTSIIISTDYFWSYLMPNEINQLFCTCLDFFFLT